MSVGVFLKEDLYQTTIYLNDRAYDVLDTGEGKSLIMLVTNINEFVDNNCDLILKQRVILVDISTALKTEYDDIQSFEQCLAEDLYLLLDVFWLEEVEIRSDIDEIKMEALFKIAAVRNNKAS
ncbi:hypothetical protein [Vibrio comitans]